MSGDKRFDRICVVVLVVTLIMTVLFMNGTSLGLQAVVDEDAETYTGDAYFTANDLNGTWDDTVAVQITLNGDSASIKGSGAYFSDGDLVIKNGGWYVISGELTDGSIIVNAYKSSKVWIRLNGVNVTCSDDSAFMVTKADKVFLTLAEGTENTFTDSETYSEEALEAGRNAAIYSKEDLTINGSGTLIVNAGYKHGIKCNDDFVMTGGTVSITCPKDGIHANDSIHMTGADVTIDAGDDAIHCDTEIYYQDGTLLVEACYEGLEAPQIEIAGGDLVIYASDDGINANGGSSDGFGMMGGMGDMGGMQTPQETSAPQDMRVQGDWEELQSERISQEPLLPAVEDGSLEGQDLLTALQSGGTEVEALLETAESQSDTQANEEEEEELPTVRITGGNITIINENGNDADGIDSNGDIIIEGGYVLVSLTDGGGNNALDYGSENGGSVWINGGTVIAAGSSSMLEEVASDSAQCNVTWVPETAATAGTVLQVEDESGAVLLEQTVPCSFSAVVISCPELKAGETYTLIAGDTSEDVTFDTVTATAGSQSGGMGFGMGSGMGGHDAGGQHGRSSHGGPGSEGGFGESMPGAESQEQANGVDSDEETVADASSDVNAQTGEEASSDTDHNTQVQGGTSGVQGMPGGQMPQGGFPGMEGMSEGSMPQMGGPDMMTQHADADDEENADGKTALSDFGADTWGLLGASVLVLLLGLAVTYFYDRRRR